MIRLADLRSLRVALDQALEHLAPVLPALEAWQASQTAPEPQEHAPEPAAAPVPAPALSSSDALPTPGLFDPLPAPVPPARRRAGNGMASTSCQRCGSAVKQQARGARKKFCSASCRAKAKAARVAQRAADPALSRCRIGSRGRSKRTRTTTTRVATRSCYGRRGSTGSSRSTPRPEA
jgi:hypothetical protein